LIFPRKIGTIEVIVAPMITFKKLGKLGRFGNQLFQYAGTRLYAEAHGFGHAFPYWIGSDIFEDIPSYTLTEYWYSRFLPTRQLSDLEFYTPWQKARFILGLAKTLPETVSLEKLYAQPQNNISILSYLQDPRSLSLLREHKDTVRSWFHFKKEIDDVLRGAMKQYEPWIGVHIRRGDIVKRGMTVPQERFSELLETLRKGRNVFIASDDPNLHTQFTDYQPIRPRNPLPGLPDDIFDFWMLMNAETIIGCGSTFSWWAAYLGNRNDYYSAPLMHLWKPGYQPVLEKLPI
jgi:hypothetical protein